MLRTTDLQKDLRAACRGWVEVDRLESGVPCELRAHADAPELAVCEAPGLSLHIRSGVAEVDARAGSIAIVIGRPRRPGTSDALSAREVNELFAGGGGDSSELRLSGRYSIVFIDIRQRTVRLYTDRFAVHSLCYAVESGRIAFSDRADCVPTERPAALDPQAFFDYAYFHVIPAPGTIFRGVSRLEPASRLTFSSRGERVSSTWQPVFAASGQGRSAPTAAEFMALLRAEVATEAYGAKVGAFLSGGTDSSTVAGLLRQVTGSSPEVFSIGFEAEGYDEIDYARIAARHFGCNHHVYYVTPDDVVAAVPKIAAQYDQPFGNSSALPAYHCALQARDRGMSKLLAGDGGDELFGGNVRYAKQKVFDVYSSMIPATIRNSLIEPILLSSALRALPGVKKASSYVAQARVPMPDRTESYNLLHRYGAENLFSRSLLEVVSPDAPDRLQRSVYERSSGAELVDRMLAYDWRFTLADNDLPKVLGTAALAGVGIGFPLLADAVVDFSLRLTPAQKVRGLTLRHWFKQALSDFLPTEIIRKKKHGFGLPFGPWMVKHAPLKSMARESVAGLVERGVLQPSAIDMLFSPELVRHPGYYGEMIWILMMAEHWLRRAAPSWRLR